MHKDAFDLWWEWAEKPVDSMLTIDALFSQYWPKDGTSETLGSGLS